MISRKRLTKKWASTSLVVGSAFAVLASPLALGSAAAATTAIVMAPHGPVTSVANTCTAFITTGSDGSGSAAGEAVTLTLSETTATNPGATPFTFYANAATPTDPCAGTAVPVGTVTGTGPYTISYTITGVFNPSSQIDFGVASKAVGTGTVTASSSASVNDTANVTWTASGADAVTSVTANPTTVTQNTGTTASYVVTAKDTNGNAMPGVTVNKETNSGASPDSLAPTACGTTNASGQVTCTIHNGGTAGTDSLVFWVNNASGTTHTSGPDNGEPQGTATAVFHAGPAVSALNSSLTCVQGLAGASQNTAQTNCTVPTSTHSVTYTATVQDASHNPLSGVVVNFAASSAKLGGVTLTGTNLPSGTGTTNASGVATFVVNDPSAANGDSVAMTANVDGNAFGGTATVHWAAPVTTALNVLPAIQSVAKGGTVTVKAQVVDQFGAAVATQPALTYVVTGRNTGKTGAAAADGTITYTDAGTIASSNSDTIAVTDATDALHTNATISYVTTTTATNVVIDTSGLGVSDSTCGTGISHTPATGVASGATTEVCAVVKNATGEPLAGKAVNFTVSNGQVAAHSGLSTTSGTAYAATTDGAGVAFADVTSTKAGAQTVTATSDAATANSTVTYTAPTPAQAYTVAVAPATGTTITAGGSQKFIATVMDKNGNAVPGVTVVFTQTGAGTIGNGNNQQITASDGTVGVTVSTATTDSGAGSLNFSITGGNQCATAGGVCTVSASYTVAAAGPTGLNISANSGVKKGGTVHVTADATNVGGTPSAGQVVRFFVTGATKANGQATTNSAGQATFSFRATKAGKDSIAAFVDTNNNGIREANEPKSQTLVRTIKAAEHPGITVTSRKGHVTVHVSTHPVAKNALVRYFVKRNGAWHQIGTSRTGAGGSASKTFNEPSGARRLFRVTVAATPSTTPGTSLTTGIDVK